MKAALLIALALAAAAPIQAQKPAAPKTPPPRVSLPPVKPPATDALKLCQTSCSRAYYFCLAQNDADTCQPSWTTCRSNCARANP